MKITIKEVHGRPFADINSGSVKTEALVAGYLRDTELDFDGYLEEIEKAEQNRNIPTGITGNNVDVEFYPDKAIIEELYPADEDNFQSVEIPLQEAKRLLLEWQKVIEEWEKTGKIN